MWWWQQHTTLAPSTGPTTRPRSSCASPHRSPRVRAPRLFPLFPLRPGRCITGHDAAAERCAGRRLRAAFLTRLPPATHNSPARAAAAAAAPAGDLARASPNFTATHQCYVAGRAEVRVVDPAASPRVPHPCVTEPAPCEVARPTLRLPCRACVCEREGVADTLAG
jgi:hypothetical protein